MKKISKIIVFTYALPLAVLSTLFHLLAEFFQFLEAWTDESAVAGGKVIVRVTGYKE